jgi:hypothetical protein
MQCVSLPSLILKGHVGRARVGASAVGGGREKRVGAQGGTRSIDSGYGQEGHGRVGHVLVVTHDALAPATLAAMLPACSRDRCTTSGTEFLEVAHTPLSTCQPWDHASEAGGCQSPCTRRIVNRVLVSVVRLLVHQRVITANVWCPLNLDALRGSANRGSARDTAAADGRIVGTMRAIGFHVALAGACAATRACRIDVDCLGGRRSIPMCMATTGLFRRTVLSH